MKLYREVWKKYAQFHGRAPRTEFWYFIFFNTLISLGAGLIDMLLKTQIRHAGLGLLSGLFDLAVIVPSLASGVRRLHDAGKSGWYFFIGLLPLVGTVVLLVFLCRDSVPGENRYGPNPKQAGASADASLPGSSQVGGQ
jgi:uncharacterized membrane protein YhaH (DUF805 family)